MFSIVFFSSERVAGQKICSKCDSYIEAYKRATDYVAKKHHGETPATTVIFDFAHKCDYDVSDERTVYSREVSYVDSRGKRISGSFVLMYK